MPISRGQMPRQLYGLGSLVKSIGKAVKGVAKGVKKVAKSDVGKAALTAAALYYGRGMLPASAQSGILRAKNFLGDTFIGAPLDGISMGRDVFSTSKLGKFLGTGLGKTAAIAAPSIIGGLLTKEAQEDVDQLRESGDRGLLQGYLRRYYGNLNPGASAEEIEEFVRVNSAEGGRIGFAMGPDSPERNAIQASGIMNLPLNQNPAGVTELDLRETGGFIPPVGVKEKADDIPAMLSNNEFVFTADAVRGMGEGDVNKGAQRLYDQMKMLEEGGRV